MPAEKCAQCGKTVYVVEKLAILNQTWHKWCFKCQVCSATLTMKNYAAVGGKPYCKAHYPMPTASGTTQEAVASVSYNSPAPAATAQTTEESFGQGGGYGDQGGYDQGGYNQGGGGGYDQGGYDQGGYDQGGYDQGGYDQGGYDNQEYYQQ
eukprot:TRINITY_DN83_c0_g2_i1.p2 TRINITY_DN83_c0_g2~~TRINITY_DN83_c0_g2_i1.p2  ORF type:complete len:151 (+),score=48.23 TRINITY_DN83_c0_g2_i1:128-580(+)